MLDQNLTAALKSYLERLTESVELEASLDDSRASSQTKELLGEIAALSDKVTVTSGDDARKPSFAIKRAGSDVAVRFAGVPLGHEFTSLVLALLQVGGIAPKVSQETAAAVRAIEGSITSRPTCRSLARTARTSSRH